MKRLCLLASLWMNLPGMEKPDKIVLDDELCSMVGHFITFQKKFQYIKTGDMPTVLSNNYCTFQGGKFNSSPSIEISETHVGSLEVKVNEKILFRCHGNPVYQIDGPNNKGLLIVGNLNKNFYGYDFFLLDVRPDVPTDDLKAPCHYPIDIGSLSTVALSEHHVAAAHCIESVQELKIYKINDLELYDFLSGPIARSTLRADRTCPQKAFKKISFLTEKTLLGLTYDGDFLSIARHDDQTITVHEQKIMDFRTNNVLRVKEMAVDQCYPTYISLLLENGNLIHANCLKRTYCMLDYCPDAHTLTYHNAVINYVVKHNAIYSKVYSFDYTAYPPDYVKCRLNSL